MQAATELEVVPQQRAGGMAAIAQGRQMQEVQAAVFIARQFPREKTLAIASILEDCSRPELAEKAVYSYPRGNQTVSGPSIRLAETIARYWGNLDCGLVELERKPSIGNIPGESVMMAFCWDLQSNTRIAKTFTVTHRRDRAARNGGAVNLTDERDIYEMIANQGARRLRACILNVIPGYVIEQAVKKCESTMLNGKGPLIDRVREVVLKFKDIGVSQQMLEKHLGHKIDLTTDLELVELKKIGLSIQDGHARREDFFEVAVGMPTEENQEVRDEAKPRTITTLKSKDKQQAKSPATAPAEPSRTSGFSRKELATLVSNQMARLRMSEEDMGSLLTKSFGKKASQLTTDEMEQLIEILTSRDA